MITTMQSIKDNNHRHLVPISGGKDSAALALYLKQNYSNINFEYIFTDTDCELPETYEFIDKLSALLGKEIIKINAIQYLDIENKPGRKAFDWYLNELYGGFLPSPRSRWCTKVLKIFPFEKYIGDSQVYSYIGIRYDEEREGYIQKKPPKLSQKQNILPVYPFKDNKLKLNDIKRILSESGLNLPKYYEWRSRSGCYFCFYQQIGEWQGLKLRHPDLFEKAKKYEKTTGPKKFTWVEGRSLSDIENIKEQYKIQDIDDTEGCAICHL